LRGSPGSFIHVVVAAAFAPRASAPGAATDTTPTRTAEFVVRAPDGRETKAIVAPDGGAYR